MVRVLLLRYSRLAGLNRTTSQKDLVKIVRAEGEGGGLPYEVFDGLNANNGHQRLTSKKRDQ